MKKIFLLASAALLFSGCAWQEPYIIAQPPGPSAVIVQSAPPIVVQPAEPPKAVQPAPPMVVLPSEQQVLVAPQPPQIEVWRPDPTQGIVHNCSRTLFVRLWIDSRPPTPPTLELGPEQAAPVHVSLGSHTLYVEGRIQTPTYGWISVGTTSRTFDIRNWSYYWGGYAWRLDINDGDFGR